MVTPLNNVNDIGTQKCVGCFGCCSVCPKHAITIKKNEKGFFVPKIDNSLCVNCGVCKSVCFKFNNTTSTGQIMKAFSMSSKDAEILVNSSSGGVSSLLMEELIKDGFTVIGCSYSVADGCKHVPTNELSDLSSFRGSKYFQSNLSDALQFIIHTDQKIAFFGLPCQCFAVKKVLEHKKRDLNKVVLVSLMCYGICSPKLWDLYLEEVQRKRKQNVLGVQFRNKKYGWHVPCIRFDFGNYYLYSRHEGNTFLDLFYSGQLFNESCYECNARLSFKNEDIRIGDFWGEKYSKNKDGVSCVLAVTNKGLSLLNTILNRAVVNEENCDEIMKGQAANNERIIDESISPKMWESIINGDIEDAHKTLISSLPRSVRMKYKIKQLIKRHERCVKK